MTVGGYANPWRFQCYFFLRLRQVRLQITFNCMHFLRSITESGNQSAGCNLQNNYSWDIAYITGQKFTDVVSNLLTPQSFAQSYEKLWIF